MCRTPSKALLLRSCRRVIRYNAASRDVQKSRLLAAAAGEAALAREERLLQSLDSLDTMVRGLSAKLEQPKGVVPLPKARRRRLVARHNQRVLEARVVELRAAIAALEQKGGQERARDVHFLKGCMGLVVLAMGTAAGCAALEEGVASGDARGHGTGAPAGAWETLTRSFPTAPPLPALAAAGFADPPDGFAAPHGGGGGGVYGGAAGGSGFVRRATTPPNHRHPHRPSAMTRPASHFGATPWHTSCPVTACLTPTAISAHPAGAAPLPAHLDNLGRSEQLSESCVDVAAGSNASEEFFASQHHEWIRPDGFDPKSPQKHV